MKRFSLTALGVLLALCLCGCSNLKTLARAQAIDREIKMDRLGFYQKIGDAYFMLGFEYYTLAVDAEERKDAAKLDEYKKKAIIYDQFSKEALRRAEELRTALRGEEQDESALVADQQSAVLPSPPPAAEQW